MFHRNTHSVIAHCGSPNLADLIADRRAFSRLHDYGDRFPSSASWAITSARLTKFGGAITKGTTDETIAVCPDLQDAQVVAYFLYMRARNPVVAARRAAIK